LWGDLEDKKGKSPDRNNRSGDFFIPRKGENRAMHLYWRIKEELLYLGEVLVFLDPRFVREYTRWVKKIYRAHDESLSN